jgi:hemerythrin-like domain-containing protein
VGSLEFQLTNSLVKGVTVDAITLLKSDHEAVSKLFKKYDGLGDNAAASKKDLVATITEELSKHAYIEETIFYPFADDQVPAVDDDIKESIQEHHVLKVTMAELARMDPASDEFDAKVTVLKEVVEHHVDEEEHEWFPKVREAIGRNDLAAIGEQMQAAKATAPTTPDPSE